MLCGWGGGGETNILVASIGEDDDGETGEGLYGTLPGEDMYFAPVDEGVALDEVGEHEDDEIPDGDECDYRCVFEGVEAAQEG